LYLPRQFYTEQVELHAEKEREEREEKRREREQKSVFGSLCIL
jgi:hypothetical protein